MADTRIIGQGDSISSIADETGHFWEFLWNHPSNSGLKAERTNPETLMPDDAVFVPDLREKLLPCTTAKRNRFRRRGVPIKIAFTVAERNGDPFADKAYTLTIGTKTFEGKTDNVGHLEHWIATTEKSGILIVTIDEPGFPETLEWDLDLGQMPPYTTIAGMQMRLNNLAYLCGKADGDHASKTIAALRKFQKDNDLDVTGEADGPTQEALREAHGS